MSTLEWLYIGVSCWLLALGSRGLSHAETKIIVDINKEINFFHSKWSGCHREGYPVVNTRRFSNARKNHCSVIVKDS